MKRQLHISKKEIIKQSFLIFNPAKHGESGIGLCYPKCNIFYNLSCFINDKKILKNIFGNFYRNFLFLPIILDKDDNDITFQVKIANFLNIKKISFDKICQYVIKKGKEPYFFLVNAHLPSPNNIDKILSLINKQIINTNRVGAMAFFESNIYQKDFSAILCKNNRFLENINIFPVYDKQESIIFLNNLSRQWQVRLSNSLKQQIVDNLGGYLWLMREAVRQVRENNIRNIIQIVKSSGIQFRLEVIYNSFFPEEKKAIIDLCFGNHSNCSKEYKEYLLTTGIIHQEKNKYILSLPILNPLFNINYLTNQLSLANNKINYKNTDISYLFSRQEKNILMNLIENQGKIVTREEIAKVIWQNSWADNYSDWAIDKHISRIREKLKSAGLSKNIINTKKGLGFVIV